MCAESRDRRLVGEVPLRSGGRVLVEADSRATYIAWRSSEGGRDETVFGVLTVEQIERVLAVLREEGEILMSKTSKDVRERLMIAIDPEIALASLLGGG